MPFLTFAMHSSWFSTRLKPLGIEWLGVIAQIRLCFFRVGHWSGLVSSIDFSPSLAQAAANWSRFIFASLMKPP